MFDIATVAGLIGGIVVLVFGVVTCPGGAVQFFVNVPAVFITFGGASAAIFVSFPARDLRELLKVLKHCFKSRPQSPQKLIQDFRRYADIARRDGILALENVTNEIEDSFLVRGIQLAVDGTDPEIINSMMRTELDYLTDRHDKGIKILRTAQLYLPSFGMIGTLIGLVVMLMNLQDPSSIGPAMAVALITTLYGAVAAYLVAAPLAEKLTRRDREEGLVKEMMIKGVMSIQSGDNPRIVEQKLKIFLPPNLREG
ncbi:MAG: motility protein A [Planctomycetota bacterium]|jgi:chemotaxis protein MotA